MDEEGETEGLIETLGETETDGLTDGEILGLTDTEGETEGETDPPQTNS